MNKLLKQIYDEDVFDANNNLPDKVLIEKNQKRILQVQKILNEIQSIDAHDCHHAALIFQHGLSSDSYEKAHELAIKAVELGDNSARWLAAASLDRFLLSSGKAQKYGTQFILNNKKEWELALPIDPSITDEERKEWNVPPIKDALEVYKQKYSL